jgi:hypothetical protein
MLISDFTNTALIRAYSELLKSGVQQLLAAFGHQVKCTAWGNDDPHIIDTITIFH